MKKFLTVLLSLVLVLSLAACGNGQTLGENDSGNENTSENKLEAFDTEATIEETVLYDENNIKITANELTFNSFSADLSVTMENNSNKDLSFICGSSGYHVNSINGYMVDDGYLNCDVAAGQSVTDVISFSFNSLNVYGITNIADIEVGFDICDSDSNSTYTGPISIKTSMADSYDYSVNRYQNIINNGIFENQFDCKINYFSDDNLYENHNICITSAAVMTNMDGEPALLLEIENNSNGQVFVNTKEVYLNNCLVYNYLWSTDGINANKKYIVDISLSDLVDKYEGNVADVSKISDISFTFSVGESWYEAEDSQKISISLPDIEIPVTNE